MLQTALEKNICLLPNKNLVEGCQKCIKSFTVIALEEKGLKIDDPGPG